MIDLDIFSQGAIAALVQVIMIDLVLAGDNAVVIGLAAAGLASGTGSRAILVGIIAATVLRIAFAVLRSSCWKSSAFFWPAASCCCGSVGKCGVSCAARATRKRRPPCPWWTASATKTFAQAAWQIVIADISMSLDNVLAVAGAARDHPTALIFGLVLSIVLMGVAASFIARLLNRHRWIAYVGLAIILYVSFDMIWRGALEVWPHVFG